MKRILIGVSFSVKTANHCYLLTSLEFLPLQVEVSRPTEVGTQTCVARKDKRRLEGHSFSVVPKLVQLRLIGEGSNSILV